MPFKGGGEVCVNLVGKHVDSTVSNPIECASHWLAGRVRPLAVFDAERLPGPDWSRVPTAREAVGSDLTYFAMRAMLGPPGMASPAVDWYVSLLQRVSVTAEFKAYSTRDMLTAALVSGAQYVRWLQSAEQVHRFALARAGLARQPDVGAVAPGPLERPHASPPTVAPPPPRPPAVAVLPPSPAAPPAIGGALSLGRYHALVIGNQDYRHLRKLQTPLADTQAVAALLQREYRFGVRTLLNATRVEMIRALDDLRRRSTDSDNVLIYYAGMRATAGWIRTPIAATGCPSTPTPIAVRTGCRMPTSPTPSRR